MANSSKNLWWVFILIAAGAALIVLSLSSHKPRSEQGVVLSDIFHQQIQASSAMNTAPTAAMKVDPVPPMAIVTSPVNGQEEGITIQVYSFQDKNRAQTALQTLINNGYQAFLIMSDLGPKGVWYRVRVGGIKDETAARKLLEQIRKNYNSGFILKPDHKMGNQTQSKP